MLNKDARDQINDLIQINIDAGDGYRYAASAVSDADLQRIFNVSSITRETFANQLQELLDNYGGEAVDDGSAKAALHRIWLTIKADLTTKNEEAVVEECIRGDEEAVELYDKVTPAATLPQPITLVVAKQHKEIRETVRQLKEWKKIFTDQTMNA